MNITLEQRYIGALAGLACGDAVGTTLEFSARDSQPSLTDMTGGGPFRLRAGEWTDDTSMALCLAESLIIKSGFDARDQMARYLNWWQWGYLSSTGNCFDIGNTVRAALTRFKNGGDPYAGLEDPATAGNGSLMRLAPVPLFYYPELDKLIHYCAESSRTTHAAPEAIESCILLGLVIAQALDGKSKAEMLAVDPGLFTQEKLIALAKTDYLGKSRAEVRGSGYAVAALEAALWCFHHTDNFEAAVLMAANLGDDADTTAAIVGQLAGAFYGVQGIPAHWMEKLHMREDIIGMAKKLHMMAKSNMETAGS